VKMSALRGNGPLPAMVLAVALELAMVIRFESRSDARVAEVKFADLAERIEGANRTSVRRAIDRLEALGVVEIVARPWGGIQLRVEGKATSAPAVAVVPKSRSKPKKKAQETLAIGTDTTLYPEKFHSDDVGLPYPIEAVLHALVETAVGPKGGAKFVITPYFLDRKGWRRSLLPLVQAMAREGYTVKHARAAGVMIGEWKRPRSLPWLTKKGGAEWLNLLSRVQNMAPLKRPGEPRRANGKPQAVTGL
jgi:hypothetical protein